MSASELLRYIEYLQGQLAVDGAEQFYNAEAYLAAAKRSLPTFLGTEFVADYERRLEAFRPRTKFDTFHAAEIYTPLFSALSDVAARTGYKLNVHAELADSPDLAPTPVSRSTDGAHLIFAGAGLFAFCNYWAKLLGWIATETAKDAQTRRSSEDVEGAIDRNPRIILEATRLVTYYSMFDTVLGYGRMVRPETEYAFRNEYLDAMEFFALAHEYAHCFLEENRLWFRGPLQSNYAQEVEFECDRIAVILVQAYGASGGGWASESASGAILLLYASHISAESQKQLGRNSGTASQSHPASLERVLRMASLIHDRLAADDPRLVPYVDSLIRTLRHLERRVREVLADVARQRSTDER